ncbi:hypothetical protein HMPREF1981_00819 [Bacteroides pyogenes F0041]|uniref:Uncharacterized protein n=1 Tax=Bacteroides pyogenes F0041 TaxID=1321819 RepID=U2CR87_9BACE|nr:hypothetical protein HMPREF1981_00819 [Bacteroides pyogenes F0041]
MRTTGVLPYHGFKITIYKLNRACRAILHRLLPMPGTSAH